MGERVPPLQQQADQFQVVLVPPHGDAVFGHAAEPGHHPLVQVLVQRRHIAHRGGGIEAKRLDLQPVDRHHGVAVVQQMMRQGEAGRAEAHHQHLAPRRRPRQRAADVERVPAGQQAVDLESPGQAEHVLQDRGLRLRDVDRLLLLVDAGLHAVVADAMAGRRHHRVVDRDRGERAQHRALGAKLVHFADLLVERAAAQGHAEGGFLEPARLAVGQALGAGILALRVAPDAVVHLIERLLRLHARVRQGEAVARAPGRLRQAQHGHAVALDGFHRHEMGGIDPVRNPEQGAARMGGMAGRGQRGPGGVAGREVQRFGVGRRFPGGDVTGEGGLGQCLTGAGGEGFGQRGTVEAGRIGIFLHRLALHEQPLAAVDRVERPGLRHQRVQFRRNPEQGAEEPIERRAEGNHQLGFVLHPHRLRRGPRGEQAGVQRRVLLRQPEEEQPVEPDQPVTGGEVGKAEPESGQAGFGGRLGVHRRLCPSVPGKARRLRRARAAHGRWGRRASSAGAGPRDKDSWMAGFSQAQPAARPAQGSPQRSP